MKEALFAYSFQGASHIRKEKNTGKRFPCQDRSFSGCFEASDLKEKKEVKLFVEDRSIPLSHVNLPFELKPHKASFSLVCVSDGHGSAPYFRSQKGAEFAIQTSIEFLCERIDIIELALKEKDYAKLKKNLSRSFVRRWISKIISDIANTNKDELLDQIENLKNDDEKSFKAYKNDLDSAYSLAKKYEKISKNSASENEENNELASIVDEFSKLEIKSIYGCTVAVYFQIKNSSLWYAFKVGDSDFFALFNDVFIKPIEDDPLCHENVTTSLCDNDASEKFRFPEEKYLSNAPQTVFLSSDGVANSFTNGEFLKKFYTQLQFSYDEDGVTRTEREIKDNLPQLSLEGSGDDITLAGIVSYDDSPEAKQKRRDLVKELARKYNDEDKYELIYPIFKPYLDRNESDFKYLIACYDYVKTTKLFELQFDKFFLSQWNKTFVSLNEALRDVNLIAKSKTLKEGIKALHEMMNASIDKDIKENLKIKTQEYIDGIFGSCDTRELNLCSYYKAIYEYRWIYNCYEKGELTVFDDRFSKVESDLKLFALASNFSLIENARQEACKLLNNMHLMKAEYWRKQI